MSTTDVHATETEDMPGILGPRDELDLSAGSSLSVEFKMAGKAAWHRTRSDVCLLLCALLRLPDLAIAQALVTGDIQQDVIDVLHEAGLTSLEIREVEVAFEEACEGLSPDVLFHEMRVEHTRLFDHPQKPAIWPYESLFLHERRAAEAAAQGMPQAALMPQPPLFVNPAALDAERQYRAAGLAQSDEVRIPADHITTELEFLAVVHESAVEAALAKDQMSLSEAERAIGEFERSHVSKWFRAFFSQCADQGAGTYRAVGLLGQRVFRDSHEASCL